MTEHLPELLLLVCIFAACGAHVYAWQCLSTAERLPLLVYSGSYVATSVIGATILGLADTNYLEVAGSGIDTVHIRKLGDCKYWLLVYLPLIIPPVIVAQFAQGSKLSAVVSSRYQLSADYCFPAAYVLSLGASTYYCLFCLSDGGFGLSLNSWARLAGEFTELMMLRAEIRESVGFPFLAVVYVGLPVLSFAALYQLRKHRSVTWWFLFVITFAITCWLGLATIQKAITLLYLVSICIALIELRVARQRTMVLTAIVCCVVLTVMQQFFQEEWSFLRSVQHITHRLAVSMPFYANIYPDVLPYSGIDFGLWVFGFGSQPTDNIDVFRVMYPEITHMQGHAAAPAHLRLYSQGGMAGMLGSLFVIGIGLGAVTWARRLIGGPISFAIYIQALVVVYYATQISLVDLFVSAYGITWCGLTLIPLWLWASLVTAEKPRQRQLPRHAHRGLPGNIRPGHTPIDPSASSRHRSYISRQASTTTASRSSHGLFRPPSSAK